MKRVRSWIAVWPAASAAALLAMTLWLASTPATAGESGEKATAGGPPAPAPAPAGGEDGCYVSPSLYCKSGDHRFELSLTTRGRIEFWDAYTTNTDTFYQLRTRVGASYSYANLLKVYAEFQDARIWDADGTTSGAGTNYRNNTGGDGEADGQALRQAWAELKPIDGLTLKGGRMDLQDGTEVMYPEPNWKYLKSARVGQRLVGGVGWTLGERANEAGAVSYDFGDYHVLGFGGKPTTGVFEISDGYETQDDIVYGGIQATAKRGALLPDTELRAFYIGYEDDRPKAKGGIQNGVEVHTLGLSSLGVYPVGPGNLDLLVWFAGQWGDYGPLDHAAAAGIAEVGYQLPKTPWKPWLRTGVNIASGDGESGDGDHHTFFNLLPTNHIYYGYADQFAFENLIDFLVQLRLQPHERVGLELMYHKFWLQNDGDGRYSGSGAFNKQVFGYTMAAVTGERDAADEVDVVATFNVHQNATLEAGYAHLWGREVFTNAVDDVNFGYLQVTLKY